MPLSWLICVTALLYRYYPCSLLPFLWMKLIYSVKELLFFDSTHQRANFYFLDPPEITQPELRSYNRNFLRLSPWAISPMSATDVLYSIWLQGTDTCYRPPVRKANYNWPAILLYWWVIDLILMKLNIDQMTRTQNNGSLRRCVWAQEGRILKKVLTDEQQEGWGVA